MSGIVNYPEEILKKALEKAIISGKEHIPWDKIAKKGMEAGALFVKDNADKCGKLISDIIILIVKR